MVPAALLRKSREGALPIPPAFLLPPSCLLPSGLCWGSGMTGSASEVLQLSMCPFGGKKSSQKTHRVTGAAAAAVRSSKTSLSLSLLPSRPPSIFVK